MSRPRSRFFDEQLRPTARRLDSSSKGMPIVGKRNIGKAVELDRHPIAVSHAVGIILER
jgi:hypothetical protein